MRLGIKIMFPGVTRFSWEAETVGIGKRDTDPLRLGPSVRSPSQDSHTRLFFLDSGYSKNGGAIRKGSICISTDKIGESFEVQEVVLADNHEGME